MATIFSKIVAGEIPSYKCAENDRFYAFLLVEALISIVLSKYFFK